MDVDVEHPDGQRTKVVNPDKQPEKTEEKKPEKAEEKKENVATTTPVDHPMENVASPRPAETMDTGVVVSHSLLCHQLIPTGFSYCFRLPMGTKTG